MTSALSVGDKVGDHWTVEAVLSDRMFMMRCSCGELRLHSASRLLGPGKTDRSCGCAPHYRTKATQ